MFAGVYGSIQLHRGAPSAPDGQDAYSVFMSRSVSLGWGSTGSNALTGSTLWGLNDAGQDWSPHDGPTRIAWFQVGLTDQAGGSPLPVQPLLACVEDTMSWFGVLSLAGVQVLLPVQVAGNAQAHLVAGLSLFGGRGALVPVRITLDAGCDDLRPCADKILTNLRRFDTGSVSFDSHSVETRHTVRLEPEVVDELWMGPARNPITIRGTVPEFSFAMAGWILELCAEACRLAGVRTTVLASLTPGG